MNRMSRYLKSARSAQKRIEKSIFKFIFKYIWNSEVRRTRHFQEWFHCPMNYVRIMELPLTMLLLNAKNKDCILDISSPKLLALYYSLSDFPKVVTTDIDDYFVKDFDIFSKYAGINIETNTFDATKVIPYPKEYFDRIFCISVLEHIPYDGDKEALRQMLRVLKPGGIAVITLPAFHDYIEEWVSSKGFYWESITNTDGAVFFQRRYNIDAIYSRLLPDCGNIEKVLFIAEKPIRTAHLNDEGLMLFNHYYINDIILAKNLKRLGHLKIPFTHYFVDNYVSHKCHYITDDWSDKHIRQVVIRIRKNVSSE